MLQIYLVHPRHGKKIAINEKERENDQKSGWKEVTKDQFFSKPKEEKKNDNATR